MTNDGTYGYQWDAEGRLAAITLSGNSVATNVYNALGQNARHVGSGETTDEAYGAGGNLLWRYTGSSTDPNQRAFVPFQGRILAEYYSGGTPGTLFDHPDEIGSITASTLYNGTGCQERLFYPYGEFWNGAGNCGMHQTFAQLPDYDNDASSDLYNTLNRHYTPMGRWPSPDPEGKDAAALDDPQTWNMYAYAGNNPASLTDPSGSMYCDPKSAVVDKNGNTVGYSRCVSEETGASEQYSLHFPPERETVSGAQATQADYLYAVATGVQRAGPTVNGLALATGALLAGGAVGAGIDTIGGGGGLISLGLGTTRVAPLIPLVLPAGQKLAQIIARLGAGQGNPQEVLQS